jgi:anti-sigma regulatory factor (Ser/Thr protein kinase)
MSYYHCPDCGVAVYGAGGRFTRSVCPECSVPLSGTDQIYPREHRPAAISRRFRAQPAAAAAGRRALETLLWNLEDAEFQVAALLMTELIANSVEHSGTAPHGIVRLDIELSESLIRIQVDDDGPGFVPAARTAASPLDSHWGLHLVDELADRWEAAAAPSTSVWFELDRVPLAPALATPHTAATDALVAAQGDRDV